MNMYFSFLMSVVKYTTDKNSFPLRERASAFGAPETVTMSNPPAKNDVPLTHSISTIDVAPFLNTFKLRE